MAWAMVAMGLAVIAFAITLVPEGTPWAATPEAMETMPEGSHPLLVAAAPVMQSIVPLIFIFFLIPGVVYGLFSGSVKSHRAPESSIRYAASGSARRGLIGTGTMPARRAPIVVSNDSMLFAESTAIRSPCLTRTARSRA